MLKSLKIENFRCFKSFELQKLGRINLLVGVNNSGKTSILEALYLLNSTPNGEVLNVFQSIMSARGEYIFNSGREDSDELELDIKHLFYGHEIDSKSVFCISDQNNKALTVSIRESNEFTLKKGNNEFTLEKGNFELIEPLVICVEWAEKESEKFISPLSSRDGLPTRYIRSRIISPHKVLKVEAQYVSSNSLNTEEMIDLFDRFVLTPEEELVIEALKAIEPKIERIASVGTKVSSARSGFRVKFANSTKPVPIGSMGDGMWRILGLALAIANAKDGVLLVDEIDTGLHFTAMTDMWKMIWETAKRLNVQVFATTHSSDCWQSLAEIINEDHHSEDGITLHRIEKDTPCSIIFNERQIAIAAERHIEVR